MFPPPHLRGITIKLRREKGGAVDLIEALSLSGRALCEVRRKRTVIPSVFLLLAESAFFPVCRTLDNMPQPPDKDKNLYTYNPIYTNLLEHRDIQFSFSCFPFASHRERHFESASRHCSPPSVSQQRPLHFFPVFSLHI